MTNSDDVIKLHNHRVHHTKFHLIFKTPKKKSKKKNIMKNGKKYSVLVVYKLPMLIVLGKRTDQIKKYCMHHTIRVGTLKIKKNKK